jgi:serine/threonine-protein kinase HipA
MSGALAVWLYGQNVARVERNRGRLRLTYTEAALRTYELGVPLLSLTLPVSPRAFPAGVVTSFLSGLLPEGDALRVIAEDLDLRSTDTYGLISALGRDCAGALVIQPDDDPAPVTPTVRTAERLTDTELADLVDNLRSAPLGIGQRVRISLGGAQEKLLLTRLSDGAWGRPVDGTPSTHILKPQIRGYGNSVENELFCMRVADHAGLRVAEVGTTDVQGRPILLVRRYDRTIHDDGAVDRIHQEDFCQALGVPPRQKSEEDGGPSLRQIAGILQAVASDEDLDDFLRATTLNVVLGNGDAHAKNFSLLHERSGMLRLAPLYDLLCTIPYHQRRLAMYIDQIQRIERVTAERIVNEASSWGVSRERASRIVNDFVERLAPAIKRAADETDGLPREFIDVVTEQLERVRPRDS